MLGVWNIAITKHLHSLQKWRYGREGTCLLNSKQGKSAYLSCLSRNHQTAATGALRVGLRRQTSLIIVLASLLVLLGRVRSDFISLSSWIGFEPISLSDFPLVHHDGKILSRRPSNLSVRYLPYWTRSSSLFSNKMNPSHWHEQRPNYIATIWPANPIIRNRIKILYWKTVISDRALRSCW